MQELNKKSRSRGHDTKPLVLRATVLALCTATWGNANAFDIDIGNEDLQVRFDNTIRLNYGTRVQGQDSAILKNPNFDDGDRNFKRNSTINSRIDLLTEFDVIYQKKYGVRVSAASWHDSAYAGSFDNTSLATSNHLENGKPAFGLSNYAQRYYEGLSGEWLDAYVFGTLDIAGLPLTMRMGQHTVNWGESLLGGGAIHGIAYGQAPLDQGKALAVPGVEAKELYLPRNQISAQFQATPELSFGAQYMLEWRPTRIPESGTYLGFADFYQLGGESLINPALPGGRALHGDDITPKKTGDRGVMARWSPGWLDGTVGVYARNFSDTMPQTILLAARAPRYFFNYGDDIDMYGVSLTRQIAGISFGLDLNYRHNMPLVSKTATVRSVAALPEKGEILGARGDTLHGVLNALGSLGSTPLFDSASWAAELTWSRWLSVESDPLKLFKGYASYEAVRGNIDAVTRNAYGLALNFTPTWYQVFPGANLSLPLSYSVGLSGNSAVASGGNEDAGSFSAGVRVDLDNRYQFDLKYVGYFGDATKNAAGVITVPNGSPALLRDRGAVYLTFKTTF